MSSSSAEPPLDGEAAQGEGPVEVELSAEEAAALYSLGAMLNAPALAPDAALDPPAPTLAELLAASGAPLALEGDAASGLRLVATRDIAAGEVLLEEDALAWCLCRSPGTDGLYVMSDASARVVATLPPWALLRTLRDTLTLAPAYALRAEAAYAVLAQLSALGSRRHEAWLAVPALPPGLEACAAPRAPAEGGGEGQPAVAAAEGAEEEEGGEGEEPPLQQSMPPRVQLLQAIAQCNAFACALPEEDSAWKRALLWPLLARLQSVADRERMFDERAPLSYLSAYFVLGSLFNHACAPNVAYSRCAWEEGQEAPRMRFVAARGIARGEEAVHSYIDASGSAEARRKKLLLTYRFRCACSKCVEEVEGLRGGGGGGGGGAAAGDPLAAHFPHGMGAEGIANYYARGGRYPSETQEHPEEE